MKIRLPSSCDLALEPQLGSLLLLELAAAVAATALRAHHLQIEGDFFHDETDEVTTARVLARQCDLLRVSLRDYRCRVLARLNREQAEWLNGAE